MIIIIVCSTSVCLGVLEIYQCVSSATVNSAMGQKPMNSLKNACNDLLVGSYLEVNGILYFKSGI